MTEIIIIALAGVIVGLSLTLIVISKELRRCQRSHMDALKR